MQSRIVVAAAMSIALAGCGGSDNASPAAPSQPGGGGSSSASTTISIVRDAGNQSFSPNPGNAPQDATIAWRNNDTVVHRIVMNDGSLDTGNIAPGATSTVFTMRTNGGNYHCSIHPGMIGSLRASSGQPPPCTGIYCE
jgi:plastocyanin